MWPFKRTRKVKPKLLNVADQMKAEKELMRELQDRPMATRVSSAKNIHALQAARARRMGLVGRKI